MGSLEQQMALFEELISQEQAPTNGILVPGRIIQQPRMVQQGRMVSIAPSGMMMSRPRPPVVVAARPAGMPGLLGTL